MKTNGFNSIVHVSLSSYRICRHYCVVHPSQTNCCKICSPHPPPPALISSLDICEWEYKRGEVATSRCHDSKISGSQRTVVLQIWQKKLRKNWHIWLSCAWLHSGTKRLAHAFLPSFDNVNCRLCQEGLLRSRNSATMVTSRDVTLLFLVYYRP